MTATAPVADLITEPGIYNLPVDRYHADPVAGGSLSATGTKKLLAPSCPAMFKHWRDNPREHKPAYDFGRALHREVLGAGEDLAILDASSWRTKAAQDHLAKARNDGTIPVLSKDYEAIQEMVPVLRRHEIAGQLFAPGAGTPEQTLVWQDEETGVWRRSLVDWLPPTPAEPATGFARRMIVPDLKSAAAVDRHSIAQAIAKFRYYLSARFYLDGIKALGLGGPIDPAFVLVLQAKEPPYLVVCTEVDIGDLATAGEEIRHALHLYRWCAQHDVWPGFADHEVLRIPTPGWHRFEHEAAMDRGDLDTDIDSIYTRQLEVPEQ